MDDKQNNSPDLSSSPTPPSRKGNRTLSVFLAMLAVVIAATSFSYYAGQRAGLEQGKTEGEKSIEDKYETKVKEVIAFIPGIISEDQEVKTITGQMKSQDADKITFEAEKPAKSILELNDMATFTATLNSETTIVDSQTTFAAPEADKTAPLIKTDEQKVALSDLKEGDVLTFSSDSDIYGQTSFVATKVVLNTNDGFPKPTN
ncbi:hypothetical protein KKC60_01640 [Patescibacteria group bacterium]|nr:hypothetical protein [Patescibacteria group bacterium]